MLLNLLLYFIISLNLFQVKGKDLPHWNEAISLAREILDKETNGIIQTKLSSTPEPSCSSVDGWYIIIIAYVSTKYSLFDGRLHRKII